MIHFDENMSMPNTLKHRSTRNPDPYAPTQEFKPFRYPTVMIPSNFVTGQLVERGIVAHKMMTQGSHQPSLVQFRQDQL